MAFDLAGARAAGATDDQIALFLSKKFPKFDVSGARAAGAGLDKIVSFLAPPTPTTAGGLDWVKDAQKPQPPPSAQVPLLRPDQVERQMGEELGVASAPPLSLPQTGYEPTVPQPAPFGAQPAAQADVSAAARPMVDDATVGRFQSLKDPISRADEVFKQKSPQAKEQLLKSLPPQERAAVEREIPNASMRTTTGGAVLSAMGAFDDWITESGGFGGKSRKERVERDRAAAKGDPEKLRKIDEREAAVDREREMYKRVADELAPKALKEGRLQVAVDKAMREGNTTIRALMQGDLGVALNQAVTDLAVVGDDPVAADRIRELQKQFATAQSYDSPKGEEWYKSLYKNTLRMLPPLLKSGAMSAVPGVGQAAGVAFWTSQGTGQVYSDLRDAGVSHEIARKISPIAGVIYASVEMMQIGQIANIGGKALRGTVSKRIISLVKEKGIDWLSEVGEEGLQEIVTDVAQIIGEQMDPNTRKERDWGSELWSVAKGAAETMWESAGPMGVLSAFGFGAGSLKMTADMSMRQKKLEGIQAQRSVASQGRQRLEQAKGLAESLPEGSVERQTVEASIAKQQGVEPAAVKPGPQDGAITPDAPLSPTPDAPLPPSPDAPQTTEDALETGAPVAESETAKLLEGADEELVDLAEATKETMAEVVETAKADTAEQKNQPDADPEYLAAEAAGKAIRRMKKNTLLMNDKENLNWGAAVVRRGSMPDVPADIRGDIQQIVDLSNDMISGLPTRSIGEDALNNVAEMPEVKSGKRPVVIVSADYKNLGGLNAFFEGKIPDSSGEKYGQAWAEKHPEFLDSKGKALSGHEAANVAYGGFLRSFGKAMDSDKSQAYRFGGDELAGIALDTTPEAVKATVEKIKAEHATYITSLGLDKLQHPKQDGAELGVGLDFDTIKYDPSLSIEANLSVVDAFASKAKQRGLIQFVNNTVDSNGKPLYYYDEVNGKLVKITREDKYVAGKPEQTPGVRGAVDGRDSQKKSIDDGSASADASEGGDRGGEGDAGRGGKDGGAVSEVSAPDNRQASGRTVSGETGVGPTVTKQFDSKQSAISQSPGDSKGRSADKTVADPRVAQLSSLIVDLKSDKIGLEEFNDRFGQISAEIQAEAAERQSRTGQAEETDIGKFAEPQAEHPISIEELEASSNALLLDAYRFINTYIAKQTGMTLRERSNLRKELRAAIAEPTRALPLEVMSWLQKKADRLSEESDISGATITKGEEAYGVPIAHADDLRMVISQNATPESARKMLNAQNLAKARENKARGTVIRRGKAAQEDTAKAGTGKKDAEKDVEGRVNDILLGVPKKVADKYRKQLTEAIESGSEESIARIKNRVENDPRTRAQRKLPESGLDGDTVGSAPAASRTADEKATTADEKAAEGGAGAGGQVQGDKSQREAEGRDGGERVGEDSVPSEVQEALRQLQVHARDDVNQSTAISVSSADDSASSALAKKAAPLFDLKVIRFNPRGSDYFSDVWGAYDPLQPKTVFLNERENKRGAMPTIMHEIIHSMHEKAPESYASIVKVAREQFTPEGWAGVQSMYGKGEDAQLEEAICLTAEGMITDQGFFQALWDESPQALRDFLAAAKSVLDKLFKQPDARTQGWYKDARAMRTAIAKATVAYQKKMAGKPESTSAQKSADSQQKSSKDRIEDFGEKIGGARKDYSTEYWTRFENAKTLDVAEAPLSKSWPEPDYKQLIADGRDAYTVAFVRSLREEVPNKPASPYKARRWADVVKQLRDTAAGAMAGDVLPAATMDMLRSGPLSGMMGRADLYEKFGHDVSLKGIAFASHKYSYYKGETDVTKHVIERQIKGGPFGNMPKELAVGNSPAEALKKFESVYAEMSKPKEQKEKAERKFVVYRRRDTQKYYVGAKMGSRYLDVMEFETAKEALNYRDNNAAELTKAFETMREVPSERGDFNRERIGEDHRNGQDATAEMFSDMFGFRGVEFGNWVPDAERQENLNRAYDSLYDLATIVGVTPKAISLGGELGLGFGSRGKGGKNPPAAHYEPDFVVINLTRKNGPGSLAHEWWHAFDNYVSRNRGRKLEYMTDRPTSIQGDGTRAELIEAFAGIMNAIKGTGLKKRSEALDSRRTKDYWSQPIEMAARSFENFVLDRLAAKGATNDYLVNVATGDEYMSALAETLAATDKGAEDLNPYLTGDEIKTVGDAFANLFSTVKVREDDGKAVMYSKGESVDQTQTPEFKRWFGDSKVVDDAGQPLVVYHGTPDNRDIEKTGVFKSQKERWGMGRDTHAHWFTDDRATAKTYTDPRRSGDYQNAEPGLVPAFLDLKNPLIVDGQGKNWREVQAIGKTTNVIEKAIKDGHDGIIIKNVFDTYNTNPGDATKATRKVKPVTTYAVFSPTQIKSATGNTGAFDATNPDIRMSKGKKPPADREALSVEAKENVERANALTAEMARMRGKLRSLPETRVAERAEIELDIVDFQDARRDIVVNAIYDYAKKLGVRGVAYSNIDTMLKNARTGNDLKKAVESLDERWEKAVRGMLYKKAVKTVVEAYKYVRGLETTKKGTTDAVANNRLKEYLDKLISASPEEIAKAQKTMAYMSQYAKGDVKVDIEKFRDLDDDTKRWLEHPNEAVPESVKRTMLNLFRRDLREMHPQELVNIIDDIRAIRKDGRTRREAEMLRRRIELDALSASVANDILGATKEKPLSGVEKLVEESRVKSNVEKKMDRMTNMVEEWAVSALDAERIIEGLSGFNPKSRVKEAIWGPMWRASVAEASGQKAASAKFDEFFGKLNMAEVRVKPFMEVEVTDFESGKVKKIQLTLEHMMFVYANSQNPSNRKHLEGTGFTEESIAVVSAALPAQHREAVDKLIDWYDTVQYPRVSEAFEKEHQISMPKEYRYFPIAGLDTDRGESQVVVDLMARAGARQAGVQKGMTKSRVDSGTAFRRMSFFGTVIDNMSAVEHYIAFSDAVRDVTRVLQNPEVKAAIKNKSEVSYGQLDRWAKTMAYGKLTPAVGNEKVLNWLRNNYAAYVLGFKATSVLMQTGSLMKAPGWVKPARILGSFQRSSRPGFIEGIQTKSPFMASRAGTYERDIQEMLSATDKAKKLQAVEAVDKFREVGMWAMGAYDNYLAAVIWDAKYREELSKNLDEQAAIDAADEVVRKTQSGGGLITMPEWTRGGVFARMMSQFKSDPSKTVNMLYEMAGKMKDQSLVKTTQQAFWLIVAPSLVGFFVRGAFSGTPWDEPEELGREMVNNVAGGVPFLGPLIEVGGNLGLDAIARSRGVIPNKSWARMAGETNIPTLQALARLQKGVANEKLDMVVDALGGVFGVTGGSQAKRMITAAGRIAKGEGDVRELLVPRMGLADNTVLGSMKKRMESNRRLWNAEFLEWWDKQPPKAKAEFVGTEGKTVERRVRKLEAAVRRETMRNRRLIKVAAIRPDKEKTERAKKAETDLEKLEAIQKRRANVRQGAVSPSR